MSNFLDDLKTEAVQAARASGKLEDIERAASVCKVVAEAQKSAAEATTQRSVVHQEGLKNWAQLLVPLLSVLTLAVTIVTQTLQQRDQQRSRDDAAWRSTIEEFKSSAGHNSPLGGLAPQVKLKPFLKSPVYGEQANQLARLVLPRMVDLDAFKDLFESVEWDNLDQMAGVSRSLSATYDEIRTRSSKIPDSDSAPPQPVPSNQLSRNVTPLTGVTSLPNPSQAYRPPDVSTLKEELQHYQDTIFDEERYVCGRLGEAWRSRTLEWKDRRPNFERTWLPNCDLSGLDFGKGNLNNASFQNINLENAKLGRLVQVDNVSIVNSAWWKAADISPTLLQHLIDCCDPGSDNEKDISEKPTKDAYIKRVKELCKGAALQCSDASLKFTASAEAGATKTR